MMFHCLGLIKSLSMDNNLICMHFLLGPPKNVKLDLHVNLIFFHPREVIAVSQDKLGKMGRRVVCIVYYFSWVLLVANCAARRPSEAVTIKEQYSPLIHSMFFFLTLVNEKSHQILVENAWAERGGGVLPKVIL